MGFETLRQDYIHWVLGSKRFCWVMLYYRTRLINCLKPAWTNEIVKRVIDRTIQGRSFERAVRETNGVVAERKGRRS